MLPRWLLGRLGADKHDCFWHSAYVAATFHEQNEHDHLDRYEHSFRPILTSCKYKDPHCGPVKLCDVLNFEEWSRDTTALLTKENNYGGT